MRPSPSSAEAPAGPGPVGRGWPALLTDLMAGTALTQDDTSWAMAEIMAGDADPAQLAAFAVLLRAKGETPGEVAGLARTMLARATPIDTVREAVDVVGTGADRAHTVNISTMAAIVVAGTGRTVVKHGNRAATSQCGTADVLEELGVPLELTPEQVARTVAEVGIGFCMAPRFHPGLRHAGPVRSALGVPTAFNFLGPLPNPARVRYGAIGCADPRMAPVMAEVFAGRGDRALVFRGDDGLDELTTTTTSRVWIADGAAVGDTVVDPRDLGIEPVAPEALRGGDRTVNAAAVRDVLAGGGRSGPREVVLLNAAAAIVAHDGLAGADLTAALARGLRLATDSVDSGAAAGVLDRWVDVGRQLAGASR